MSEGKAPMSGPCTNGHGTADDDIAAAYVEMPLPDNEADVIRWYATYFETLRSVLEDRIDGQSEIPSRGLPLS